VDTTAPGPWAACAAAWRTMRSPARTRTRSRIIADMGWVFLEILAVLAIAIGIVWWTIPKPPKERDDER
jgi:hypothetical protein